MENSIIFFISLLCSLLVFVGILQSYKDNTISKEANTIVFCLFVVSVLWTGFYYLTLSK
jgi:hypothetical protein